MYTYILNDYNVTFVLESILIASPGLLRFVGGTTILIEVIVSGFVVTVIELTVVPLLGVAVVMVVTVEVVHVSVEIKYELHVNFGPLP